MIPRPTSLVCERCDTAFDVLPLGKVPRFCSQRCQKGTKVSLQTGGTCSICAGPCGPRSLACSRRECQVTVRSGRAAQYARDHKARTGEWPSKKYGTIWTHEVTCLACGRVYRSQNRRAKYCNKTCWAAGTTEARHAARSQLIHVGPPTPRYDLPPNHPARAENAELKARVFCTGPCTWCGAVFVVESQLTARFCSDRCKRYAQKAARGHRFRISPVRRREIYERDAWICQLCHEPVDPTLLVTDQWAATLDHIECQSWTLIPDHSPSNLRLAHRWCNSVRADESHHTAADLVA